jgi:hypothetical protein
MDWSMMKKPKQDTKREIPEWEKPSVTADDSRPLLDVTGFGGLAEEVGKQRQRFRLNAELLEWEGNDSVLSGISPLVREELKRAESATDPIFSFRDEAADAVSAARKAIEAPDVSFRPSRTGLTPSFAEAQVTGELIGQKEFELTRPRQTETTRQDTWQDTLQRQRETTTPKDAQKIKPDLGFRRIQKIRTPETPTVRDPDPIRPRTPDWGRPKPRSAKPPKFDFDPSGGMFGGASPKGFTQKKKNSIATGADVLGLGGVKPPKEQPAPKIDTKLFNSPSGKNKRKKIDWSLF